MDYQARYRHLEYQDVVLFINACFACTRQQEFYSQGLEPVSIAFLHQYMLGNYRRLYARTLAVGVNHFNRALIVFNLLSAGAPKNADAQAEEGALIANTLKSLPVNRVFKLFRALRQARVNNRRTRAVIRTYLAARKDPVFDAVKYRNAYRDAARHAHLPLPNEFGVFLFDNTPRTFKTPLFESFRQAHYSHEMIYALPYTVAEGLAAKHGIPREQFLRNIAGQMTAQEKLRLQQTAERQKQVPALELDLSRMPPTRLAIYFLSLSLAERKKRYHELHQAMLQAVQRTLHRVLMPQLGKVAAVLDSSYSASGSNEKKRRPLAVALAADYLLSATAREYQAFWTLPPPHSLAVQAKGWSNLGEVLLDALTWQPEQVIIVSDGFDNAPPYGAAEVARVFYQRLDPEWRVPIIHFNPVFDAEHYAPRSLGDSIPTVGLRDAEDMAVMLEFVRFASDQGTLDELLRYLQNCTHRFLHHAC